MPRSWQSHRTFAVPTSETGLGPTTMSRVGDRVALIDTTREVSALVVLVGGTARPCVELDRLESGLASVMGSASRVEYAPAIGSGSKWYVRTELPVINSEIALWLRVVAVECGIERPEVITLDYQQLLKWESHTESHTRQSVTPQRRDYTKRKGQSGNREHRLDGLVPTSEVDHRPQLPCGEEGPRFERDDDRAQRYWH